MRTHRDGMLTIRLFQTTYGIDGGVAWCQLCSYARRYLVSMEVRHDANYTAMPDDIWHRWRCGMMPTIRLCQTTYGIDRGVAWCQLCSYARRDMVSMEVWHDANYAAIPDESWCRWRCGMMPTMQLCQTKAGVDGAVA